MEFPDETKKLIIRDDLTIEEVNDQLKLVVHHLAELSALAPGIFNADCPYEIDLSEIELLDGCGCQLLAALFCDLRKLGMNRFTLKLSPEYREKIKLLGFGAEIFRGECA